MTELLRRFHIWVGLFNLTILVVFGVTGIFMTFPREGAVTAPVVRNVPYVTPPDMTDKQVADDVWEKLRLPLVDRISTFALRHDDDSHLQFTFHSPKASYAVTVLEAEKSLHIEERFSSLGEFVDVMHGTTRLSTPDLRMRLWTWYVILSIGSLLFMALTGVCLWLATRPTLWWARLSFAAGSVTLGALWFALK